MKHKIIHIIILLLLPALFASCVDAGDDKYTEIPDIEVSISSVPSEMLYGKVLKLSPTVSYAGDSNPDNFTFQWYKQNGSNLTPISEAQNLECTMDSLGTWNIFLRVTNKSTDVFKLTNAISINVISTYGRGWYVLKETPEGNTDLDFFAVNKDSTTTQVVANQLLTQGGSALQGKPVDLLYVYNFRWKAPGTTNFTSNIQSLMVTTNKDLRTISISENKTLSEEKEMFMEQNTDYDITGGLFCNKQTLLVNHGKVQLMLAGMQAFLPVVPGEYNLSPYWTISNYTAGYQLGFDNASKSFIYLQSLATKVDNFPDKKQSHSKVNIPSNHMPGTISFLQNTDGNLNTDTLYSQRAYSIFHEDGRTDRCIVLGLDMSQCDPSQTKYGNAQYNPITFADTISYAQYPEIGQTDIFTLHKNYPILYFAYGNKVGSYGLDNKQYKPAILTYPANETVTYMYYMAYDWENSIYEGTAYQFSYLVIATADTDGNYHIYRYKIAGNDISPVEKTLTGKGKVKKAMYISTYFQNPWYLNRYY